MIGAALTFAILAATTPPTGGWRPLWNETDLSGWHVTLGGQPPGRDDQGVFTVVKQDGRPALRVSGEIIGGLTTDEELEGYHLHLAFKWGEARHGPRAQQPRDSGLLYHATGTAAPKTGWFESVELGILEGGETGDFWSVPGRDGAHIRVDVEGDEIPKAERRYPDQPVHFRAGAPLWGDTKAAVLSTRDLEKPRGQWNTIDLYVVGTQAVHVVNGQVALTLGNLHVERDGKRVPLTRGRVQLQSEYAETFFRDVRVRPLAAIPPALAAALPAGSTPNALTKGERAAGWKLLFDGKTTRGWRALDATAPTPAWRVQDGALVVAPKAGDLVTSGRFGSFELQAEWRTPVGGNSGIYYFVDPTATPVSKTAPEYELRDNAYWPDDPYKAGGLYGLEAPRTSPARPPGEWNRTRIVVDGDHVEHWLNGERVVAYDRDGAAWKAQVAASKFKSTPAYARARSGHLLLQEHGAEVAFRNVKIRELKTHAASNP